MYRHPASRICAPRLHLVSAMAFCFVFRGRSQGRDCVVDAALQVRRRDPRHSRDMFMALGIDSGDSLAVLKVGAGSEIDERGALQLCCLGSSLFYY
ncbi:hypothetical protein BD626DRAFT_515678 [Schizophyllum amplum]|uniref:Uncharacterized protein n=1 Tax=Schizophyllum amplum TaxID=97359 RepID=A0A550BXL9_9AGAR|nr:hypothetical protein BD626DRAFT_515664 [Auriculariopsis ampla]TRM57286.1 hypothetical protein BD626DRAFT_515678 [Auriculariopsis ampla]